MDIQKAIDELKYQNKMWAKGIDYQVNNLVISEAVDALERKADYLKNMDYFYKINLWLLQKYGNELYKEFGIDKNDISSILKMFNAIYEEQCKEMPLPWYQYGFGSKQE